MGFRFNKRLKILPGVHLNLGLGGASLSIGGPGASVNVGRRGVYGNVGIPGTGMSYRHRLDSPGQAGRPRTDEIPQEVDIVVRDGRIEFLDGQGREIPEGMRSAVLREHREAAEGLLQRQTEEANAVFSLISGIHLDSVPPGLGTSLPSVFPVSKPLRDVYATQQEHMEAVMRWRADKANHEASPGRQFDVAALEAALAAMQWPRETNISYQCSPDGSVVVLDVDLPEIEDMPAEEAVVNRKSLTMRLSPLSQKRISDLYSAHVASIVFRLAATAFANSPASEVRVSGYTQRSGSTGHVEDEYVIAVIIDRARWLDINFAALTGVDPENALRRFGASLERTGRGALRSVNPCPGI